MKCVNCGYDGNKEGSKFCKKCGAALTKPVKWCVNCGKELTENEKFCTACGTPQIEGVTPGIQKEKKTRKKTPVILGILLVVLILVAAAVAIWFYWEKEKQQNERTPIEEREKEQREEQEEGQLVEEPEENEEKVAYGYPIPVITKQVASSTESTEDFNVNYLQDKKADTAWAEGTAGLGADEYVVFSLKETQKVYGIAVLPGNLSSNSDFQTYAYPRKLTVCGDGVEEAVEIINYSPDFSNISSSMVFCDFEEPIETDEIIVYIKESEIGGSKAITAISEMYLYYYPLEEEISMYYESDWEIEAGALREYMLAGSDTKYLTMQDLDGLTAEECRIARNEIYARHGRIFDDKELQTYFSQFEWYEPKIKAEDFKESMLNQYEVVNRDLIVEYEEKQGYR